MAAFQKRVVRETVIDVRRESGRFFLRKLMLCSVSVRHVYVPRRIVSHRMRGSVGASRFFDLNRELHELLVRHVCLTSIDTDGLEMALQFRLVDFLPHRTEQFSDRLREHLTRGVRVSSIVHLVNVNLLRRECGS